MFYTSFIEDRGIGSEFLVQSLFPTANHAVFDVG